MQDARHNADLARYSRRAIGAPNGRRLGIRHCRRNRRERHPGRAQPRGGGLRDQGARGPVRDRARAPGAVLGGRQTWLSRRRSRRPHRTSCQGPQRRPVPRAPRCGPLLAATPRRHGTRPAYARDRLRRQVDDRRHPCGADQPACSGRTPLAARGGAGSAGVSAGRLGHERRSARASLRSAEARARRGDAALARVPSHRSPLRRPNRVRAARVRGVPFRRGRCGDENPVLLCARRSSSGPMGTPQS